MKQEGKWNYLGMGWDGFKLGGQASLRAEGRQRPKKEAGHSRLVSGSLNKERELTRKAYLGWQQEKWIRTSTHQILKTYKEVLTGVSHVYLAGVFSTTSLSQGRVLGTASGERERQAEPTFQRLGRG